MEPTDSVCAKNAHTAKLLEEFEWFEIFEQLKGNAMATRHENFTVEFLNSLPAAEKGKRYAVHDIKIPQLSIRVTDAGTKSFSMAQRLKDKTIRIVLGKYPAMTIAQARQAAVKQLTELSAGKNPNEGKRQFRQEKTLGDLFKEYMERYSKKTKRSWIYDEREIPKFLSHWFSRKISDITQQQIRKLHEEISENNGVYQANRMLERIKSMYNRAIEWGWDGKNPAVGIKKNKEVKRDRFLLPAEFPAFFKALNEEENEVARNYIWMSLLTGARKSNVLSMRWDEIDFKRAIWRIPETKNGDPLDVPLIGKAMEILNGIPRTCEWVFPNPESKTGHFQDPKKAWARILDRAGIKDLRIHDIRRTLGSYQAITGASLTIIGKSLGHKSTDATQVYARLHDDPVRASIDTAVNKMLEYKESDN